MKHIILTGIFVILFGALSFAQHSATFSITFETDNADQVPMIELFGITTLATDGKAIAEQVGGKIKNSKRNIEDKKVTFTFDIESKKAYNNQKFCEKIRKAIEDRLVSKGISITKSYCNN